MLAERCRQWQSRSGLAPASLAELAVPAHDIATEVEVPALEVAVRAAEAAELAPETAVEVLAPDAAKSAPDAAPPVQAPVAAAAPPRVQ